MCGLSGFVDFNKKISPEELTNACNSLSHRGPDDNGTAFFETNEALIGLGHRRLAILDLSPSGHQPMYSPDRSLIIILNGEIYNYKELRLMLESEGETFVSNTDTEVVLKYYQRFGMGCLDHFIGMFAIVIYDSNKQKVFLIRDRAGIKPLYYYFKDGCMLFASELKAFHKFSIFKKEINQPAVSLFFKYGYIKAPHSIFKNAHKLVPGCYAILNLANQSLQHIQYWNLLDYYSKPKMVIDEKTAVEELDKIGTSAFEYCMVSDVPTGVFLSGGYDSTLVTAILQRNTGHKIKTFTIGFKDEKYNEANYAAKVAHHLGTDHATYYCDAGDAQQIIETLPYFYDEPFGDSSAIPTMLLSRFAKSSITVALAADGGDELFAGYTRYYQLQLINNLQKKIPSFIKSLTPHVYSFTGLDMRLRKILELAATNNLLVQSDLLSTHFLSDDLKKLLQYDFQEIFLNEATAIKGLDVVDTLLAADFTTYLPDDILTKTDRATMSAGIECRAPLLDHRLAEWAAQLPVDLKYKKGNQKYLVKQLVHKYLPAAMMDRPKMGFAIPFGKWLRNELKELLLETVNDDTLARQTILNAKIVMRIRKEFLAGNIKKDWQMWLIFMFMLWWKEWMR